MAMPLRVRLLDELELVVARALGTTIMLIWDLRNDRCASGPLVVRDSELVLLRRTLAAFADERPS